ncbi:putative efflux pump antibiotic resistance protein [Dothidotthia symphoricarpi CBS 119687]|uniref:Putative efflux pump antibiotic resistance protein n=1 Tax=Dothidotthia symphoricarpi CBS 119687 TaxID=1392245 RepID=A0A6A5ZW17_9PLEO|nr:putative efflux pump antibiotic resistance protein [Dothidotthia symphoricarpi CBS 119687]KAF2123486.1 putative efflux pump antibiotic resistance protein [Dothidotthia symphoricarpi CBS 119687]
MDKTPSSHTVAQAEASHAEKSASLQSTASPDTGDIDEAGSEGYLPGAKVSLGKKQFWSVFFGLNLGMLLVAIDFNIVATAVPTIASEFHEYKNSAWLATGFLVSLALVLPIYSKLGSIFGNDIMFNIATLIFILGSGLCGGSKSMKMLVASRVIQGIGGGGIYGLVNVIVTDLVPLKDVGKYLSITGLIWVVADVAGPLLGGVFSQYASWRWCFYINLCISPISLAISLCFLKLPKTSRDTFTTSFLQLDYLGILVLVGGTVCILLGVSWGGNTFAWSDGQVVGCLIGGFVLLVLFIVIEHRVRDPLIDPSLFRSHTVLAITAAEFFFGANLIGLMYYIPQFFQLVFGDSATISGVGLLPMMLGLGVGNPIAAFITSRYELSLINAQVGAALMTLTSGLMARWNVHTSRAEAVVLLIVLGMGQGAAMSGLLLTAQVATQPHLIGIVTGLVIFVMTVGDIFGVAFFAAVYINKLRASLAILTLTPAQITDILQDVQSIKHGYSSELRKDIIAAYAESMRNGWWLMFACAGALFLLTFLAKQNKFKAPTSS